MEFQLDTWLELFTHRLLDTFPGRVIFLGIQGSRGRGESKPDSDIDMVVVLDQVGLEDLRAYRELLRTLPHGGLTCGFFCGREELLHWPRYDLLQLVLDTKPLYGGLENLLPAFSPADTAAAVHIGLPLLPPRRRPGRVSGLSGQVRLFPAAAGPLPPLRLLRRHHGRAQAPLP